MATSAEYTAVANALVAEINNGIAQLSGFEQNMIRNYLTAARENAMAGQAAKVAVDTLDQYRSKETSV